MLGPRRTHDRRHHHSHTSAKGSRAFVDGPRPSDRGGARASSLVALDRAARARAPGAIRSSPQRFRRTFRAHHADPAAPHPGGARSHVHEARAGPVDASRPADTGLSV